MDKLIRRLGEGDPHVRMFAARGLGKIRDAKALPMLEAALDDEESFVRRSAAQALGRLREPSAATALASTLRYDVDADVRARAAEAIGRLGTVDGIAPLAVAAEHDEDETVRWFAVRALGRSQATDALLCALSDSAPSVRREALSWLERYGDAAALPAIRDAGIREVDKGLRRRVVRTQRAVERRRP